MEKYSNVIPISDTNSTLHINFKGNFDQHERSRVLNAVANEIPNQTIYCNDLTGKLWIFDYKSSCGYWIENISFENSLENVYCTVCESTKS